MELLGEGFHGRENSSYERAMAPPSTVTALRLRLLRPLEPNRPVLRVNWYEAEAYCTCVHRQGSLCRAERSSIGAHGGEAFNDTVERVRSNLFVTRSRIRKSMREFPSLPPSDAEGE